MMNPVFELFVRSIAQDFFLNIASALVRLLFLHYSFYYLKESQTSAVVQSLISIEFLIKLVSNAAVQSTAHLVSKSLELK